MSQPALQRIASGLAGAQAALLQGELAQMHAQLEQVLDALAEVTRAGFVPSQEQPAPPWEEVTATRLVWQLLGRLHAGGCPAFPYAGTLLGLERAGRLLAGDKDADFAVWLEHFALAGRLLQDLGLRRASDVPPFSNVATYVEPRTGYTFDLFGLRRDAAQARIEGGAWLPGRPAAWQRVLQLPWFELAARQGPAGPVWWPATPDVLLQALYGDWRTPQPEWDAQVCNLSLQELNLSWQAWACKSLCQQWLTGDLARTLRLLDRIIARGGATPRLLAWRAALAEPPQPTEPRA